MNLNIKWEPGLIALAEREACCETRMVGGLRLKHWYEYIQSYNPSYWRYTCLICSANIHETFAAIRCFDGQSDVVFRTCSEMRAILAARSNVAVRAIEAHAAAHTSELREQLGVDLLDAAEAALRLGMDSQQVVQDILMCPPRKAFDRKEQLPWR